MRKRELVGVLVVAVVVAAATGGTFAWRARGQSEPPIIVRPTTDLPDVVATVNGEPIPGLAVAIYEANGMSRATALTTAIEQVLLLQAARRLGLEATEEEAAEYIRDLEADWANVSDERRQEIEALLIAQGLPTSNLADNPDALLFGRAAKTTAKIRGFLLDRLAVAQLTGVSPDDISSPQELAAAKDGLDAQALRDVYNQIVMEKLEPEVARFVQQERANAEIIPIEMSAEE